MTVDIINNAINKFVNGDTKNAIELLKNLIRKNTSNYLAIYNLGYFYQQLQNLELAKKNYLDAIELCPNHWESKINLMLIYIDFKQYKSALKLVEEVLILKKDYQPALRDKALILYNLKRYKEALHSIELSIKLNNKDFIALNTFGIIQITLMNLESAKNAFLKAIKLNNKYDSSFLNLGRCLELLNLPEDSIKCFLEAKRINPKNFLTLNNIASHYVDQGYYMEGIKYYLEIYEKNKDNLMILSNLAKAYFYINEYKLAEELIQICLKKDKNNDDYKKTYAFFLFKQKKYPEAWNYYEGRLMLSEFNNQNIHAKNIKDFLWSGKKIDSNKKILVIKEQGIGDEILYGTIYLDLFKNFPNAMIESDPKIIDLFKKNFTFQKNNFVPFGFFSNDIKKLKNFDVILYAASLGKIFRQKLSNFSTKKLFVFKNENTKKIKDKLDNINKDFKIGISWKSFHKKKTMGKAKSIELEQLSCINDLSKISLINVQYGNIHNEVSDFNKKHKKKIITINGIDIFNDLEKLGELLSQLDLLITISNTTAHLAASLGLETWLIAPPNHASFHYWNQFENYTPWYKNVKLFKNEIEIEKTILEIKKDLEKKYIL